MLRTPSNHKISDLTNIVAKYFKNSQNYEKTHWKNRGRSLVFQI